MKGGIGTASMKFDNGVVVGALVAVNSVGNVIDPKTGRIVAGARSPKGRGFIDVREWAGAGIPEETSNTTIGVIATNVYYSKTQLKKIAQMGHDGMARTINPVHTPWDGDTLFAMSTAVFKQTVDAGRIGALAAEVVSQAILRAVQGAKSLPGYPDYPSCADLTQP
jgi:L-aminopeptidase/D-esterase-like protein